MHLLLVLPGWALSASLPSPALQAWGSCLCCFNVPGISVEGLLHWEKALSSGLRSEQSLWAQAGLPHGAAELWGLWRAGPHDWAHSHVTHSLTVKSLTRSSWQSWLMGVCGELRSEHSVILPERAGGTASVWGAGKASASAVPEGRGQCWLNRGPGVDQSGQGHHGLGSCQCRPPTLHSVTHLLSLRRKAVEWSFAECVDG